MNEKDEVRLRHMLDEARRVQKFINGRSLEDMETDDMLAYADVSYSIIWDVATINLPGLIEELETLLPEAANDDAQET